MVLPPALAPFEKLRVWAQGSQRAPHKPLLVLLALGRLARGDRSPLLFAEVEPDLRALLEEFGPSRRAYHAEYPFWRLQNDGVWKVEADEPLVLRASNTDPLKSELVEHHARGRFTNPVLEALTAEPRRITDLARRLLDAHFPTTIHDDIAAAVGLELERDGVEGAVGDEPERETVTRHPRDPSFRPAVLGAYEDRCAVCGYDLRLGPRSIGLDAAHIRWHQAGGPDDATNGLALCTLHHKIFDLGAFTLSAELTVLVSSEVRGTERLEEVLMRYHGRPIRRPQFPDQVPAPEHLEWHRVEVFKGREREVGTG